MKCPICQKDVQDEAKFCKHCGNRIPRCPQCGNVLTQRVRFCPKDGTTIPPELVEQLPEIRTSTRKRPIWDAPQSVDTEEMTGGNTPEETEIELEPEEPDDNRDSNGGAGYTWEPVKPDPPGESYDESPADEKSEEEGYHSSGQEGQPSEDESGQKAKSGFHFKLPSIPALPDRKIIFAVIFILAFAVASVFSVANKLKPRANQQDSVTEDPSDDAQTEEYNDTAYVYADSTEISVGETTYVTFYLDDEIIDSEDVTWESNSPTVVRVNEWGEVTGISAGTAQIIGRVQDTTAYEVITVTNDDSEYYGSDDADTDTDEQDTATGLGPMLDNGITQLPESIYCGMEDSKRRVQGVEWNTDTMETFYVSYGSYIVAYNKDGSYKTESNDVNGAYLFSMDYFDNLLFSVFRSSSYGKFKLRIYDAETLVLINSTDLSDIHEAYIDDNGKYGTKLIPSIDGITVAPAIGGGDDMKIYVSYNSYYSAEDGIGLNDLQKIFEYDYESSIDNQDSIRAERRFDLDLGGAEYGIQTLEYDSSTGNIWCAIRQGDSSYSLYCIDHDSTGKRLELVPNYNNDAEGWDCPHAGDGLCSLGNDVYSVLIPTYYDNGTSVEIRQVHLDELEYIG